MTTPDDLRRIADAYDQQEHMHSVLRQSADRIETLERELGEALSVLAVIKSEYGGVLEDMATPKFQIRVREFAEARAWARRWKRVAKRKRKLREALRKWIDARNEVEHEAARPKPPAFSSAPMIRCIRAEKEARQAIQDDDDREGGS